MREVYDRLDGLKGSLFVTSPEVYRGSATVSPDAPTGEPWPEVDDYLMWHLRGTDAEKVLTEARGALTAFSRRYNELWSGTRKALEEETGLPLLDQGGPERACLYATAVDLVYKEAFRRAEGGTPRAPGDVRWMSGSDERPSALSAEIPEAGDRLQVAFGGTEEHGTMKRVLESWLTGPHEPVVDEAREISSLYHDLLYLVPVVEDELGRARPEDIGKGLCPDCPYPEVLLDRDGRPDARS